MVGFVGFLEQDGCFKFNDNRVVSNYGDNGLTDMMAPEFYRFL